MQKATRREDRDEKAENYKRGTDVSRRNCWDIKNIRMERRRRRDGLDASWRVSAS